ncbi:MBL fold metallo-hydrolase [Herpetosiphon sp. NSE202]|uniref:MBL fold metallo-hydrolase n=1 Tax=Herpetosiphon sp. NSE202 TaxID=3351349 RepID=UPI003636C69F
MQINVIYVGTATVLLEIDGLRILTDPVFDPAGSSQVTQVEPNLEFGLYKQQSAALQPAELGPIDLVLLSHDDHYDNLDTAGRAFLPHAKQVLTTKAGSGRLQQQAATNVQGLAEWQSITLNTAQGLPLTITAVPAQHGPVELLPIIGDVIGFVLEYPNFEHGPIYISGDTVLFAGIQQIAERYAIGTAFLHVGAAQFAPTGPTLFTFDAEQALQAAQLLKPHTLIPIHFDGWQHFSQGQAEIEQAFAAAPIQPQWLIPGLVTVLEV